MLATLVGKALNEPGWVFEEKYDGIRVLAYKEGKRVSLLSRNDMDRTENFPEIVATIANLKPTTLLLDGEIVVFDRSRVSRFQLLQQGKGHPFYAIFDCLYANGSDLRQKPLSDRRKMLERVVPTDKALLLVLDSIIDDFEFNVASLIGRSGVQALFHSAMVEYHARVRSILRSTIIFSNPAR